MKSRFPIAVVAVALSAIDAPVIDALAFGGAGSGSIAGGGAISANVITNTIGTAVSGSTVRAGVNDDGTTVTNVLVLLASVGVGMGTYFGLQRLFDLSALALHRRRAMP